MMEMMFHKIRENIRGRKPHNSTDTGGDEQTDS